MSGRDVCPHCGYRLDEYDERAEKRTPNDREKRRANRDRQMPSPRSDR